MMLSKLKQLNPYKIAVLLATSSFGFGIVRELIIVGLLGFTAQNDALQIYLSIFYTIGLTIDAMRLACLNLYQVMTLPRLLLAATIIALPFSIFIGFLMSYATAGLNPILLSVTIIGSYLNLMTALLITYKQRDNSFLAAQIINVLPNLVLIPGIFICYFFARDQLIFSMVVLTSCIPVLQCVLLARLPQHSHVNPAISLSWWQSLTTFIRHFSVMFSEQLFQIITRAAFYRAGAGYLSMFAVAIRIYSGVRFILIDSYIGSRLANWQTGEESEDKYLTKLMTLAFWSALFILIIFLLGIPFKQYIVYDYVQISMIIIFGFSLTTLVRIVYFKINRNENNAQLVLRFSLYEFLCVCVAFLVTRETMHPILLLLWIGYVLKPLGQLLLLRRVYHGLVLNYGKEEL